MVCHAANRAYCESLGDYSQPFWGAAPEWQRQSTLNGVRFHLGFLETGRHASPSASHEAWLDEKSRAGWKYGPSKDPMQKTHPCCRPYRELPVEQRVKDYIFASIVDSMYTALQKETSLAAS